MNDWDNLDNIPADDDDNDDFDRLNDDSNDFDSTGDDEDLAWLSDSEDEDTNDAVEPAEPDVPDWLSGMDIPEVSEEEIVAAQQSISTDNDTPDENPDISDDDGDLWGSTSDESSDVSGDDDDLWGSTSDESSDVSDDGWGLSEGSDESESEAEGDSWLASSDDNESEVDDFLFGASSDDFLFGADSDDEDSGELADIFEFDDSSEGVTDSQDSGGWGDLDDFDFDAEEPEKETVAADSGWDLSDSDDDFDFQDEPASDTSPADDLGVPDWLSDMPVPGDDTVEDVATADDLGAPDWLSDMPVPGDDTAEDVATADDLGVPDWLEGGEPVTEVAGDDLMDLLGDFDDDEVVAEATGDDLMDLLGDFDDDDDSSDLSDLLATLDDGDDSYLDDLLSSLDSSDDDAGLDDLFASLEGTPSGDESDDLDFLDDISGEADDLDFLEPVASESDGLDFLDDISGEADDLDFLEPVASESNDLDFLDDVSGESDDLDFLEPVAEESGGLDFLDYSDDEDSLEDDELALLNLLNRKKTSELDFMAGISRDETVDEETQPEIDDDELAILNQLSKEKTGELDFMADISRDEQEPEIDDELSQQNIGELDFMEGISRDETGELHKLDSQIDHDDEFETGDDVQAWFDAQDTKADEPVTGSLAFIDNLDSQDEIDDSPDWLDEISGIDTDTLKEVAAKANEPEKVDIDSLIDSFDFDDARPLDEVEELLSDTNLDSILDVMDEDESSDELSSEALPGWLQEIQKGETSESAAALLRERSSRSLDDLDDRLLDLRERGREMSPDVSDEAESNQRLAKVVPNIDEALSPARVIPGESAIITVPNVSPEQEQRANMLQNLVGASLGSLDGLADAEADTARPRQGRASPLQSVIKRSDRIIIALLLVAAVIVPFVYPIFDNIAILPPGEFAEDSDEFAAFTLIENLTPGSYVLIATEYGATGARELDTATRSLLEHVVTNGGIPVIVGSNAVGLLRAESTVIGLLGEEENNNAYYIAGLLPGGNIGLRDFASNVSVILNNDLRGNSTGLELSRLDDFASIIIISESGETVRNWMEQIAPITDTSIIVVTGQAARPIALPYVTSSDNTIALLTSYEDAFTYQQMSLAIYNPSDTPTATLTFTPLPTSTSTATATPLPTDTATATALPTDTAEPTATALPTDTPEPTLTGIPSVTARPTNTPGGETSTPLPTDTPEETATPEASNTPEDTSLIEVAVVISNSAANVRAGAGTTFNIVTTVVPGERLAVQETSLDGEWYNVILPDGSSGWLAGILVDIIEIPSNEFEGLSTSTTVQIGTVISEGRVNVRSGAGSEFDAVAGLDPDSRVRIIGTNDAGDWYNIVLPNGGEGWIATFLLTVQELPADEWQGASKDGYYPIYFSRPPQVAQSNDDSDMLLIGRNNSGSAFPLYAERSIESDVLVDVPNRTEFIVIEEGEVFSQILLDDGTIGFFQSHLFVTDERARSEIDFAPTVTPTMAPTFTPTPFEPQITPAPLSAPETRSSSQALGLLVAIMVIGIGNLFWIFRWLGQKEQ